MTLDVKVQTGKLFLDLNISCLYLMSENLSSCFQNYLRMEANFSMKEISKQTTKHGFPNITKVYPRILRSSVSVNSKRYHPLSKFLKTAISWPPGAIFLVQSRGPGLPGTLNSNKFHTFSPFSRHQSLIYSSDIYRFVGIT